MPDIRNRSAVSGRFASAEDAAADPERHVAERVEPRHQMRVEWMNQHFCKVHTSDGVLHLFLAADGPDSDPHDHPFSADITVLSGGYVEQVFDPTRPSDPPQEIERREGDRFRNEAGTVHRIVRLTAPLVLTEFRPGPWEREPGFYRFTPDGVLHRLWHEADFRRIPRGS